MKFKNMSMLFLTLVLVVSLFAACGEKKDVKEPDSGSVVTTTPDIEVQSAEEPTTSTVERATVNVAYMPNYGSLSEVVPGVELGYFDEEGLDVNLIEFADGPTIIAAMESGSIDIGYIGSGAHKLCIQGKAKIFAIAQVSNGDAVLGLASKGVNTPEDLRGKTVAYASGTASESILKLTLESVGMTMDDIVAVEMDASAIVTAIISGSIDACATWSPNTLTIAKELGDDVVVIANNLSFIDNSAAVSSWIVTSSYAENNVEIIQRYTNAIFKAKDYRGNEANYEQVARWIADKAALDYETVYNQHGDAEWQTGAEVIEDINNGTVKKLYESQQATFLKAGDIEAAVPVEDYVMFDIMLNSAK